MSRLLRNLSISTNVCPNPAKAVNYLSEGSTDLIIVDWQEDSGTLLQHIKQSRKWRKPTVMVVSDVDSGMTGTYPMLRKPVTSETGAQSLKQAYSRMLEDHRQHIRHVLMQAVTATTQQGRLVPVTVMNIGEGGIGLNTKELLSRGDMLSFSLVRPDTDIPVRIEARVLWTRQYGAVGCEFVHTPSADLHIVYDWLKHKCLVKKPLIEL